MSQMDPVPPPLPSSQEHWHRRPGFWGGFWGGGILILIGVYFLLANLGWLDWLKWDYVWPVVLIAIGVYLVARRFR